MSARAVVLCYHAIETGPPPLCIEPGVLEAHLDVLLDAGVRVVELRELAGQLEGGGLAEPSVAITFDDGCASVFESAVPLLLGRGMPATVFCVADHLGGWNDWATEPASSPRLRLASAGALAEAARHPGIEIGSHGATHLPLGLADRSALEREVVGSRETLERATGGEVTWFAYPAGSGAGAAGRALVRRIYEGAADGGNRPARPGVDRWALPRIEMHYLRRPSALRRAVRGADPYLALRRAGGRARRLVHGDFRRPPG